MQQEEWFFGTAVAAVFRDDGAIVVRLRGAVTAMVFEALHMRLGREPAALRRTLVLGDDAMLLVTCISAAEASIRGTPRNFAGLQPIVIAVPAARMTWGKQQCDLVRRFGLCRSAACLEPSSASQTVSR